MAGTVTPIVPAIAVWFEVPRLYCHRISHEKVIRRRGTARAASDLDLFPVDRGSRKIWNGRDDRELIRLLLALGHR
jgi:hypothetical protein